MLTDCGSSPRARGTLVRGIGEPRRPRFIPASAGNTIIRTPMPRNGPVHPRERGEHQYPTQIWMGGDGSSPRARGTRCGRCAGLPQRRFIPASAGNTCKWPDIAPIPTVHPRERGEHGLLRSPANQPGGSSPRARGTQRLNGRQLPGRRFIPASAGNTICPWARPRRLPVHPRERGEHGLTQPEVRQTFGSSPRARGTPLPRHYPASPGRFIPASAGNTVRARPCWRLTPVHPRERGEHVR